MQSDEILKEMQQKINTLESDKKEILEEKNRLEKYYKTNCKK
jgi:hypothetical protein